MSSQIAYRLGDGAPVTMEAAHAIWTAVAREVLEEGSTSSSITHSELARQVQQRSGVYTRMPTSESLNTGVADVGEALRTATVRPEAQTPTERDQADAHIHHATEHNTQRRHQTKQTRSP